MNPQSFKSAMTGNSKSLYCELTELSCARRFVFYFNIDGRPTSEVLAKFDVTKSSFVPSLSQTKFKWLGEYRFSFNPILGYGEM